MNSNWSYSPEIPIRLQIGAFLSCATLKFDSWPWKTIRHLFYVISSFVYNSLTIGEFKLELQSENAQFGSKSAICCPVRPWNLTDDLEKQQGTSFMLLQAMCVISKPSVNWNWSYGPENPKLGQNLLWPLWPWLLISDLYLLQGHHVCQW